MVQQHRKLIIKMGTKYYVVNDYSCFTYRRSQTTRKTRTSYTYKTILGLFQVISGSIAKILIFHQI